MVIFISFTRLSSSSIYLFLLQFEAITNSTLIDVRAFETLGAANGPPIILNGHANTPDGSKPGELSIKYDGIPADLSFNILALGPVVNGTYQWSIVTNSNQKFLYVFARDVDTFKSKYDSDVLRKCYDLRYTFLYTPITLHQGSDCMYEGTR